MLPSALHPDFTSPINTPGKSSFGSNCFSRTKNEYWNDTFVSFFSVVHNNSLIKEISNYDFLIFQ